MKSLFITLLFISSKIASAGFEVGNGGDIVLCPNQASYKPMVLDLFEMKNSPFTLKKIAGDDEYQVARKVFEKLQKVSPDLKSKYLNDLKEFRLKTKLIAGQELVNVPDSFHTGLPKGCMVKQIAIQRRDPIKEDTVIHISKDLYERLEPMQKAALIVHEIVYEHFRFFQEWNSLKVRIFTRYLFSEEILTHEKSDLMKLSEKLRVPLY